MVMPSVYVEVDGAEGHHYDWDWKNGGPFKNNLMHGISGTDMKDLIVSPDQSKALIVATRNVALLDISDCTAGVQKQGCGKTLWLADCVSRATALPPARRPARPRLSACKLARLRAGMAAHAAPSTPRARTR